MFYKLLKTQGTINITSELKEKFDSVKKALSDACQLALKDYTPGKQLVLMTDASFRSAGYAVMIEDNPDQKIQSKRRRTPPWRLAQKFSPPRKSKYPYTQKHFWPSTWYFSRSHRFFGKQQNQQLF